MCQSAAYHIYNDYSKSFRSKLSIDIFKWSLEKYIGKNAVVLGKYAYMIGKQN